MRVIGSSSYSKRIIILGCTIFFIIVLLVAGLFFVGKTDRRVCGVLIKSEELLNRLIVSKTETEGFSSVLRFAGKQIPYDEGDKTFYICQDMSESRWQGIITADVGKIYFVEDEAFKDKRSFIEKNKRGKLYLIGPDSYEVFDVCFSGMPIMNINRDRDYVSFFSPKEKIITSAEYVGNIEKRGGRSRRYKKKSFKLTFAEKQQLLDMRNDDDWILNALYDDMGLIHNAVSYEVWNQISRENDVSFDDTIRQEYVELLVDGEYRGVYGLSERLDDDFVGLKGQDIMYKVFGWPDWEKDCMEALECKYPKEETQYVKNFVRDDLLDFYVDSKDYDSLKKSVYYENALDFQIFIQLTVGIDNTLKNSYLVYKYDEGGERKLAMIPWDCNATWGSHFMSYYAPHYIEKTDVWSKQFARFYEIDEKQAIDDLYDEWLKLRETVITEKNISSIIECNLEYLHSTGAYDRNYERWPCFPQEEDDEPHLVEDEWKDEYIFEFVNGRIELLDKYFEEECK